MCASMIIWGTPVTPLQFFGYGIALCGMIYYKLGYDNIKAYAGEASRQWAEFGQRKPVARKVVIIVSSVLVVFVLLGGLAPAYAPDYDPTQYLAGAASKIGMSSS